MNVKPGDLAVIRPPRTAPADDVTGLVVTVVKLAKPLNEISDSPEGRPVRFRQFDPLCPSWVVESNTPQNELVDAATGIAYTTRFFVVWDHRLRPLRDPGDDAKDETLSWKPVPSTKEPKREILALPVKEM